MKRKDKIVIVLSMLVLTSAAYAQFKTNYFLKPPDENSHEGIGLLEEQGAEDSRFRHRQLFSARLSFYNGAPISSYAYTNMFSYQMRDDLRADIKIHGVFINPAYQDLWGSDLYLRPHMAMDAGVKYSPMNNGLFDIHARTYHRPSWNGQSVYLTLLGIPIKRLYTSKSFNDSKGLYFPGFLN